MCAVTKNQKRTMNKHDNDNNNVHGLRGSLLTKTTRDKGKKRQVETKPDNNNNTINVHRVPPLL